MSQSGAYFLSQAETCAEAARTSPLPQLRDKYLRAQVAWQALADKEDQIRDARERRIAERLAVAVDTPQA